MYPCQSVIRIDEGSGTEPTGVGGGGLGKKAKRQKGKRGPNWVEVLWGGMCDDMCARDCIE